MHQHEAFEKGQDIHMQAAPSQAELLHRNYKIIKEKLKSQTKDTIIEKYGNAASDGALPRELLLGQSEREIEYDRTGRIIKGQVLHILLLLLLFSFLRGCLSRNYSSSLW
jgi:pre-mRNA-processing factor SLU7